MALLDDILSWTETKLPAWQRDAVRRLFQRGDELTGADYDDLYALLKAAHGLPNQLGVTPEPLKSTHLPSVIHADEAVIIKAMRDLKYVNRIAPRQKLNFAPSGISVIYGGNGSGKSGYARVLKRACRARDQAEKVLSDAHDPTSHLHIPEGIFDIEIGGTSKSLKWKADSVSPDELSSIAVFDCHCARVYLTTAQDVTYLPYGLDVVENLANKVLPELSHRLELDISCINVDQLPFNHLMGETEVGRLISVLNEMTDPIKIKSLGTLSKLEIRRIAELEIALAEADPNTKAIELRLSAGRIKELVGRIDTALAWVSKEAITKLKELDESEIAAVRAAKHAAEALQSGEALLPGTGEQVWKALFDAARKFSKEVAYPEQDFPHTTEGALCPLCQQPLNDAGDRLKRFNEYVQNDVAKTSAQKQQEVETEKTKIKRADLSLGLDESLAGELALLDETVVSLINAFQTSIENRRIWMLLAIDSHDWNAMPDLNENPRHSLRNIAARQLYSARTFAKAADENKKKLLSAEHEELRARQNLCGCLEALLALLDRMKKRGELESCKKGLKTKSISDKSKEFASSAVTATLKKALDDEFKALGIGHIKTKLKDRNEKGKILHQLLLDLPTSNKIEQILSEGEQRAIALGSFLAELKLANHNGRALNFVIWLFFAPPLFSKTGAQRIKISAV